VEELLKRSANPYSKITNMNKLLCYMFFSKRGWNSLKQGSKLAIHDTQSFSNDTKLHQWLYFQHYIWFSCCYFLVMLYLLLNKDNIYKSSLNWKAKNNLKCARTKTEEYLAARLILEWNKVNSCLSLWMEIEFKERSKLHVFFWDHEKL
jgi:hypothetical protein